MPVTNLATEVQSFDETFSVGRIKQSTITRMTGDEIANVDIQNNPLNILCIQDGVSYKKGHFYVITNDGVIQDTFLKHDHTTDDTGGSYYDILKGNYNQIIEMDYSLNISRDVFYRTQVGTGAGTTDVVTSNQKYMELKTGTATSDHANIEGGGGRLFFGKPITLQVKYQLSNNLDVTYRIGVGQPLIQNAIHNNISQLGFYACSGDNNATGVFSSDGTSFNAEWLSPMVYQDALGLRLDYYPSSKIIARDGLGVEVIKQTNLPQITAATNSDSTFRAGIRVTAPGTAKILKIFAVRLLGYSYDSQAGVKAWV